jgi:hypothetical protein
VRGGKGNDPIKSIVRDILVPVQGDYALCVEIANWDLLHVGRIEHRGQQRDAHASSYQCESTIVLIRPIDYLRAYSAIRQKLRRAVEGFTMSSNDEALSVEIGQLNAFIRSKAMVEADHQSIVFP